MRSINEGVLLIVDWKKVFLDVKWGREGWNTVFGAEDGENNEN